MSDPATQDLVAANIARVQELVGKFQAGDGAGYIEGCSEDFRGSILSGVIPGGESIRGKEGLVEFLGKIEKHIEIKKFEPVDW